MLHQPLSLISSKFKVIFVVPPALETTDDTLHLQNPWQLQKGKDLPTQEED
jgi:hypothetical protein